jgi:hypothetical protein
MPQPTVLHPRLGRRILLTVCSIICGVVGVGAATSGAVTLGGAVAVFGAWGLTYFGSRLVLPHAAQTDLTVEGFRVHDAFGRVVHDVPWSNLARLVPVRGNAPGRPGGDVIVGFDLVDPDPGRPKGSRRKGPDGKRVDGILPDPYDGYEAVVERMRRYAESQQRVTRARPAGFTPF